MATAAVVNRMSVEEYLRTPFRPDVGISGWGD